MTIARENLDKLNKIEARLIENQLWLGQENIKNIGDLALKVRDLRQSTISLSINIICLLFPLLLLSIDNLKEVNYFITSLILFSTVPLLGLVGLIMLTLNDRIELPKITSHHIEQSGKMLNRIREIKKIENNNEAGIQFQTLESEYKKMKVKEADNLFPKILRKYEDLIIHSLFIVGFIFLLIGMFKNLSR